MVAILEQTFREQWGRVLAALIGFLDGLYRDAELNLYFEGHVAVDAPDAVALLRDGHPISMRCFALQPFPVISILG